MQLRDHLQAIADDHDGVLTPAIVVEAASEPAHPLHDRFDWDDTVAAERWRLAQGGALIRKAMVRYREATATEAAGDVRAWVNTLDAQGQRVYRPIHDVAGDDFASALLLREAEREWQALHRRYGHLAEFVAMVRGDVADQAS